MELINTVKLIVESRFKPDEWLDLRNAANTLSDHYRSKCYSSKARLSAHERYAYLLARLPATGSAITRVLRELKDRMPDFAPTTMADIGAGPGTASWVAAKLFDSISNFSLIEKDPEWIGLGKEIAVEHPLLKNGNWMQGDMTNGLNVESADLLVVAYALQEIGDENVQSVVRDLWSNTTNTIAIVEPGTPKGFGIVKSARAELIELGAHIVAPCSHQKSCPMQGDDWCHFSERFERSREHRQIKRGTMGFEDEKYSYLIASKYPSISYDSRVIRAPIKRSGHIILDICRAGHLQREIISRSKKEQRRQARKAEWGSVFTL